MTSSSSKLLQCCADGGPEKAVSERDKWLGYICKACNAYVYASPDFTQRRSLEGYWNEEVRIRRIQGKLPPGPELSFTREELAAIANEALVAYQEHVFSCLVSREKPKPVEDFVKSHALF